MKLFSCYHAAVLFIILFISVSHAITLKPPKLFIDLSSDPFYQYTNAIKLILDKVGFMYSFEPVFTHHNKTLFNNIKTDEFQRMGIFIRNNYPSEAKSLDGISESFLKHGYFVSFDYLAGWVWMHELGHTERKTGNSVGECTGILTQDTQGKVWHGRNMDQQPGAARNLTLHIIFTDAGNTVMEVVDWYWFTAGFVTVMSPGLFSGQSNWRFSPSPIKMSTFFESLDDGAIPHVYIFKQAILKKAASFESITNTLINGRLSAPIYFVAAGNYPGQGMIIARDETTALDVAKIGNSDADWSLVQTNYDHWKPDIAYDPRRTLAENCLKQLGREEATQFLGLHAVLTMHPVGNDYSIYNALMNTNTNECYSFVMHQSS